ncbi:hypothetical protein [Rhodococcus erythropolis]|uniref:hypothetical protein n=1 Tax=Rhodococcus erythropolis TaxID=1833 RepID=UPI0020169393|nr:hypothetical protein [Rhodococcus erythropolis]
MIEKTRPRRAGAAAAWSAPGGFVERPGLIPGAPEIWVYADKFSYFAGDTVSVRVHTTADEYDIEVVRDGAPTEHRQVHRATRKTTVDARRRLCDRV